MSLLAPLGLLALLSLPIIAILHLVRQRRRRTRVPALFLWEQIKAPPERKQRRLPLTLLLLLHLLVAACLALALANPALIGLGADPPTHTAVILDITSSMATSDISPSRFAQAQNDATDLIEALGPQDSLTLISLEATPRILGSANADDRQLAALITNLRPAGNGVDLPAALDLASTTFSSTQANRIIVLTDGAFLPPAEPLTVSAQVEWRLIGAPTPNAAIVAFAARPLPNGETALFARAANFGTTSTARTIALTIDGEPFATQQLALGAGQSQDIVWRIPPGGEIASATLDSDDALPGDDQAMLPLTTAAALRVRLVTSGDTNVERALAALPGLNVTVATTVPANADPVDVTVLNGVLPEPLPPGPLLIINPPDDPRLPQRGQAVRGGRASSAALDPLFAGIDLSSVQWERRQILDLQAPEASRLQPALTMATARASGTAPDPLVVRGALGGQPVIIWAFDPDRSNLPAKIAFPLLTALSIQGLTTGVLPATLPPGTIAPPVALQAPDGAPAEGRLDQAGLYTLSAGRGAVAINLGDERESNLAPQPRPTFIVAEAPQTGVAAVAASRPLWWLLIIVALGVLGYEWYYSLKPSP